MFSDLTHIKDVVGTTRLNRPSLKVTSPGSPQQKKKQMKNVPQIVGRLQVWSANSLAAPLHSHKTTAFYFIEDMEWSMLTQ